MFVFFVVSVAKVAGISKRAISILLELEPVSPLPLPRRNDNDSNFGKDSTANRESP